VATRGLSLERARRQKWLTALVVGGISLTALAVAITYRVSANHRAQSVRIPPSPAPDVQQQLSGYTFTRSEQGRPVFTIRAARTVSYQQSKATVLQDVTVQVFGRKGDRGDILRTHVCEYNSQSGDFLASGPVEIELSAHSTALPGSALQGKDRVFLQTSKVTYHQEDELAETDEPVKFRMGSASGSALGMVYATQEGWIELKHDVVVDLPQGKPKVPEPPIHLTAAALRYDKESGLVGLTGPVEVSQGGRRAVSESATITLDVHNRVSQVNLDGHTQAFDVDSLRSTELDANRVQGNFDAASGQLRHLTAEQGVVAESKRQGAISRLTAQRVDLDFTGKHPQPVRGMATGDVHIDSESQAVLSTPATGISRQGPEKKALSAPEVRFEFRPDGHNLKNGETVGPGTIQVTPADAKTGQKVITAGQFLMTFDAHSRIESLHGLAPTKVLFLPPATGPAETTTQQTEADRLDAVFDVGTQTLREVRQTGDFQYRDGDRHGSADDAHYDVQTQMMELLGHPQVWDTNSRIKCRKITIDTRTNTSFGEGNVQATQLPSPAIGTRSAQTPTLPTNVLADRMVARQQSQTIQYQGHVRAWHGNDVVESSALDVYRTQKRVTSDSQVVTSFLQPAAMVSEQGGVPPTIVGTRPVTIRADSLEYFDQGRRARYHGNVRLVTENTTLQSDRLDVYFAQGDTLEGSEVDYAEAQGHVKITEPGRVGFGDRAEYFAGPGKIVLTGGQPSVIDAKKGSTTGQRLTFFMHDDRLFVDGGDQTPSLSKHRVAP